MFPRYTRRPRGAMVLNPASLRVVRPEVRPVMEQAAEAVFATYDGGGRGWRPQDCPVPDVLGDCHLWGMHMALRAGVVGIDVDGRRVCGKLFYDPGLKGRLRASFRCSKGRRAFRCGVRLMDMGIPVPQILGYAESRSGMGLLLTELVEGLDTVGTLLGKRGSPDGLLRAVGLFIRRLHDAGVAHSDLSPRNVLVRREGDGWSFLLLDYEDATFHRNVPPRVRKANVRHMAERFVRFSEDADARAFHDGYQRR